MFKWYKKHVAEMKAKEQRRADLRKRLITIFEEMEQAPPTEFSLSKFEERMLNLQTLYTELATEFDPQWIERGVCDFDMVTGLGAAKRYLKGTKLYANSGDLFD